VNPCKHHWGEWLTNAALTGWVRRCFLCDHQEDRSGLKHPEGFGAISEGDK